MTKTNKEIHVQGRENPHMHRPSTPRKNTRMRLTKTHTFEKLHAEGFEYLADNAYIHSGYRLHYTFRECFLSLFELHNETLNVWTHMVGSFIFIILMAYLTLSTNALRTTPSFNMNNTSNEKNITTKQCQLTTFDWCVPSSLLLQHGHHTSRLVYALNHPQWCPLPGRGRIQGAIVPEEQQRRYYQVASILFEHSLHQIPSLEKFYAILEENVDDLSHNIATQMKLLQHELTILKDRLSHVTDSAQIVILRESLNQRVEGVSSYLKTINDGADLTIHYALEELRGVISSVKNGIHIISRTDTHHVPHWPLFVFMISAVICLTCSAIFHLLFVCSRPMYLFLSRLDYAGITILIAGSFYPTIYYSFYCYPRFLNGYLGAITTLASITFVITLMPKFSTVEFRLLRTCVFLALGFFGFIPLGHLVWHFGWSDPHITVMVPSLMLMAFLYVMGAVIYATRFPERFYPGRFDVFCSSHQLWHVCVVAAALVHFMNSIQQYEWRWDTTCDM